MAADTHLWTLILAFVSSISILVQASRYHEVSFIESPQYSVALPGDSVYFSCRTNLPLALENITWLHNGQPLISKASKRGGDLTFKVSTDSEVFKNQEGTYQCVGGAQGSQFQVASLEAELSIAKLEDFRKIKNDIIEVFEGNDIVVPCEVPKSVPPAFVQFAKNDELLPDDDIDVLNGNTLLLKNVTLNSSGNYSCIASNHITDERQISPNSIILRVHPVTKNEKSRLIYSPRDNYEVKLGDNVYVPCTASGVPKPEIIWSKLNNIHNDSLDVQDGILTISKAEQGQTGHYMCAVFNGARRFVRRTSVTVIVPPEFVNNAETFESYPEGDTLTMPCQASGSPPPIIQWRINGLPIKEPAAVNRITGDLVIPNANAGDHTGFYQCFAENKAGQITFKSFVQVGEDILSSDDYETFEDIEPIRDFQGYVITKPTKPNVTQVSAESVVLQWTLQNPEDPDKPLIPVKFFKIQFREFFRGKRRSSWHTLDEDIGPDVRAFEILGLHSDRRYRFRVVVVFENNDMRQGPLSGKFKMNSNSIALSPRPKPPGKSPSIIGVLPLSPTSLRIGWVLNANADDIEGYFIYYKPSISDEKFKKITILGSTSHAFIVDALIPGTEYEMKVNYANLCFLADVKLIGAISDLHDFISFSVAFKGTVYSHEFCAIRRDSFKELQYLGDL